MVRIASIQIENVRGISSLSLEPRTLTVLTGANEAGKTSVIEAIRVVFAGGYDGSLVRNGETTAKIKLTLTDGVSIERVINRERKSSTLTIKTETGEVVPSPQKYVERLATGFAYDPLAFLAAKPKERASYIEKFASVQVASAEIQEVVRDGWWIDHYDPKASAFENIDSIYKAGFERRADINRKHRDLEGTIKTLRAGIPTLNEDGADWAGVEKRAREELSAAREALAGARQQVHSEADAAIEHASSKRDNGLAVLDSEYRRKLAEINAWRDAEEGKIRAEYSNAEVTIAEARGNALVKVESDHGPMVEAAATAHSIARSDLDAYNKASGAREQVDKLVAEIKAVGGQSAALDRVLDGLKKLRTEKLSQVPIPGLEIQDGKVILDGVEFDSLNTAKQIEIALMLATQNPGEMEFMLLDKAEHLDESNWEAFKDGVAATGWQVIAARVGSGALAVETV